MLHAVVVSNGIEGIERFFRSNSLVAYRLETIGPAFDPDLRGADIVIVPNGSDHVAMLGIREKVRAHLNASGTVMCFDGWFTDWVPGNRWVMDNSFRDDLTEWLCGVRPEPGKLAVDPATYGIERFG